LESRHSTCLQPSFTASRARSAQHCAGFSIAPHRRLIALGLLAALTACDRGAAPPAATGVAGEAVPGLELGAPRPLASPAAAGSGEPHLAARRDGAILLSWIEPDGDGHALRHAELQGDAWTAPRTVASGADWIVSPADLPAVEPVTATLWAAHWRLPAEAGPYAYDVAIAVSADSGATWSPPQLLNDDGTPTEHGFVSVFDWDGAVGAVWLDGRGLAGEFETPEAAAAAATTLRFARLGPDARSLEQGVIDEFVCDCCTTGIARAAGGELLVYRDRTPEEIRDVQVRRRSASGWGDPVTLGPDGWEIEGCPINGPAIDAAGASAAAAWFTAPDDRPKVRVAFSADGGATFGSAIDVDTDGAQGHVDVVLADAGTAVVSWWRRGAQRGSELAARVVAASGVLGPIVTVASSAASRPDDVPQMIRRGNDILFAWTEPGEAQTVKLLALEVLSKD
jgi:hypothetical protein